MEVLSLQVFVSLVLVTGSIVLFVFTCRQHDFDHADRLALLPLDDGAPPRAAAESTPGDDETHE